MRREARITQGAWRKAFACLATLALSSVTTTCLGADVDGIKFLGDQSDRNVGIFVGGDGDFNADGVDDLVIAAWKTSSTSDGRVYVVYGGLPIEPDFRLGDLLNGDGSRGVVISPDRSRTRDRFGRSADFLGDVNGDGIDDLIVGSIYSGRTGEGDLPYDAGEAYVIFGRAGGLPADYNVEALFAANGGDGSEGFVIRGFRRQDELGRSVSRAGDLNGDGMADLVVGALVDTYIYDDPTPGDGPGEAYVIYGRADGAFPAEVDIETLVVESDGSEGFVVRGVNNLDRMGIVAEAGDVDGDGIDDLVLGAISGGVGNSGEAYVVYGRTSGFPGIFELASLLPANGANGAEGFVALGSQPGDRLGLVHGAGDVNGDGFDDVLMGAYRAAPLGLPETGVVYLLFGRPRNERGPALDLRTLLPQNGGDGSRGVVIPGSDAGDRLASVSTAGNVNADDYDDFIVGSFRGEEGQGSPDGDVGEAYLIFGRDAFPPIFVLDRLRAENGADGSSGTVIIGEDPDGRQGRAVSSAGDFDGDGYDDVVTGAWQADGEGNGRDSDDAGEAYLSYGRAGLAPASLKVSVYDDPYPNPLVGACAGSQVTLYEDDSFTAVLATFPVSVFDALAEDIDDRASAVAVDPGLRVSLYRDTGNLDQPDLVLTEDLVLTGGDANEVSALVVECLDPSGTPAIINPGDQRNSLGELAGLRIEVADDAGAPYTFAASGLPPVLRIIPATGQIAGAFTQTGEYDVEVDVTSAYGASSTVAFRWVVADAEGNVPPTLVNPGDQSSVVGTAVALQLMASDADEDPLTFSASSLPEGLVLDPLSGLISGVPTREETVLVSVVVEDGRDGSASVDFLWTVAPEPNVAPTLENPGEQRTLEGEPVALQLSAFDQNGDALTFSATGLPQGLGIDPLSGLISGVPTLPQVADVVATVDDGRGGSDSVVFTWIVEEINVAPTLENPGDQLGLTGTPVSLQLAAADANGDPLSFSAEGLPAGLQIDPVAGLISGAPTQVETTAVTATVIDGRGGSASVTFSWTVEPAPNQPPVLDDPGPQRGNVGDSVSLQLVASDPDGDPLDYSATGLPDGLAIDPLSGLISGVPTTEQVSNVVASVADGQGGQASVSFTWTIERAFDQRLQTAPFVLPEDGDSATQLVDLTALGVTPGDLVRVSDVRALGDLDSDNESFSLAFDDGDTLSLALTSGEKCTERLEGVIPELDVWVTVEDIGGGTPGISIEGETSDEVGDDCDGIGGEQDVAVQYVLEVERGTALRAPLSELPEGGDSATQLIDLSALGIAVGDPVQISDVRAQGDLDDDGEVFELSFNDGAVVVPDLTVVEECTQRLDPLTLPVAATVRAIDLGGGTPGISVTGTTDDSVGGFCSPIGAGDDIAVQYTLVVTPTTSLRTPVTELPRKGTSKTFDIDLSGLAVAIDDQVTLTRVSARGDLDDDDEFFDLQFNGGELTLSDLAVPGECVGLEPVTGAVEASLTVIDLGSGVPGITVTGTTSEKVDDNCDPADIEAPGDDEIAMEVVIEIER